MVSEQRKKRKKGNFSSKGPNFVHSLDGHDKMMGYQNSTFPLAVYGCIDTASRKIMWLRIWTTNSNPKLVGRWYVEHLLETRTISRMIRLDKGTETGVMANMHEYLRRNHSDIDDPVDTILYGPSTSNQVKWFQQVYIFYFDSQRTIISRVSSNVKTSSEIISTYKPSSPYPRALH